MKKSIALLILIVAAMVVAAGVSLSRRPPARSTGTDIDAAPSPNLSPAPAPSPAPAAQVATGSPGPSVTSARFDNQKAIANLLHEFTKPQRTMDELVRFLRESRQRPFILRDKNEVTGEMDIVRTKSPLPGTRYFHAQYFSDENNQRFLQHMSFELPGNDPQAWSRAFSAVQSSFPSLGAPLTSRGDFVEWDAGDGYSLWMKRLDASDLRDHPFNAYTSADVGTIRVAVELNPEVD